MASFSIGIDLGTTNCALASIPLSSSIPCSAILLLAQAETSHSLSSHSTLPSFLYLPPGEKGKWIAGRFARSRAAEVPGRVVHSAKSWLVHHAADRRAKFLPLGSSDLERNDFLSPVQALSHLLEFLASAWNEAHPEALLAAQEVVITVPASFDPAAQQLTLEAARQAGFPAETYLIEEPQAAFLAWLENNPSELDALTSLRGNIHILVVDIGGGTTDLSLFSAEPSPDSPLPRLKRIAVSDHLLLGGDNLDLALAHTLEERLVPGGQLPPSTFAQLLSLCRDIKEEGLAGEGDSGKLFPVAVSKPGASLLSGTLRCEITAHEVSNLLLEGFFPRVTSGEVPLRAASGLREMGLPYAKDPAVTRHISDFLRDRPQVDFVLFNGGLTKAPAVRNRILENLARWQPDHPPAVLENSDPDLAVACGAARFGFFRATGASSRIEAGASHSYYLKVGRNSALCILPQGAPAENDFTVTHGDLRALVSKPASFELLRHSRRADDSPGDFIPLDGESFSELPSVETILAPPAGSRAPKDPSVRVKIQTRLRSTGLLDVALRCAEPGLRWDVSWPLQFALRGQSASQHLLGADTSDAVTRAGNQIIALLDPSRKTRQKLTANVVFQIGEKALGSPKANWTGGIVRRLFDLWIDAAEMRFQSAEHEETWLHLAGWFLRPGCGMIGDPERAVALASILSQPLRFSSGAVKIQRWICARRIAACLDPAQAHTIWSAASAEWRAGSPPSAEIALLAASLESLPSETRLDLVRKLVSAIQAQPANSAFWKSLGRLLSRAMFHAGTEQILPPDVVDEAWAALGDIDPGESLRPEAGTAWLRAARMTGLRPVDVSKATRNRIDAILRGWGINEVRRRVLYEAVPLATGDRTGLLGEAPPPGLTFQSD